MSDFEQMLNDLCKMSKAQLVQMVKNTDEVEIALNIFKDVMKEDYVRVPRCKDCKHKLRTVANGVVICGEKHGMIRPSLDDFCSYGEYQTNTGGSNNVAD